MNEVFRDNDSDGQKGNFGPLEKNLSSVCPSLMFSLAIHIQTEYIRLEMRANGTVSPRMGIDLGDSDFSLFRAAIWIKSNIKENQ
jgi:hypothetical protein